MIGFRDIKMLATRIFRSLQPEIRTHLIGQVVSYDATRNTAEIQPVVNQLRFRDAENLTTKQLPVLMDVPVKQVGSGKGWLTFTPAVGTYGTLHIADREIETWLSQGGIVDPADLRLHSLSDAIFEPSLFPLVEDEDNGLFASGTEVEDDRISLRTRTNTTAIAVKYDETLEIKNEKCTITIDIDGNISITTEGDISAESTGGDVNLTADGDATLTAGGTVTLDNGTETASVDGADVKAGGGADYVALAAKTQANFDLINTIIGTTWVPVPQDGGAALKTAWGAAWAAGVQQVASANLKAD